MATLKLFCAARLVGLTRSERTPVWLRDALLRTLGVRIAAGVTMRAGTRFSEYRTRIAEDAFIGADCYFEDHSPVIVGRSVWIGAHTRFYTASHAIGDSRCRAGAWFTEPITVGDGTWIGGNATVLPGVRIGPGCVVAAGSVVREDCAANGLYAGVPAVRKRDLV